MVGYHILENPNTIISALKIFATETNVIFIYVDILRISYLVLLENSTIWLILNFIITGDATR